MNKKDFIKLYNSVKFTLFYKDSIYSDDVIKLIAKNDGHTYLSNDDLSDSITKLNEFDINLLWDKKFWGLKPHESISAVASEKYTFLKRSSGDLGENT